MDRITVHNIPGWLSAHTDALAAELGVSRSAAFLALAAVGWHNMTVDTATYEDEPDEVAAAFRDKFDQWEAAGNTSPIAGLNDLEYFIITEILPAPHGGKRPGAGRPKAHD